MASPGSLRPAPEAARGRTGIAHCGFPAPPPIGETSRLQHPSQTTGLIGHDHHPFSDPGLKRRPNAGSPRLEQLEALLQLKQTTDAR